jgi:hypothetical protein
MARLSRAGHCGVMSNAASQMPGTCVQAYTFYPEAERLRRMRSTQLREVASHLFPVTELDVDLCSPGLRRWAKMTRFLAILAVAMMAVPSVWPDSTTFIDVATSSARIFCRN